MTRICRPGIVTLFAVPFLVGSLAACRGEKERATTPTPGSGVLSPPSGTLPVDTTSGVQWNATAGRALVVSMGTTGDSAMIVRPEYVDGRFDGWTPEDVQPFARTQWDLFGRSGGFGTAQLNPTTKPAPADGCITWPSAGVSTLRGGWRVALEAGHATPVPFDSVEAMTPQDSAHFVVDVTRLAASTRGRDDSLFASIPFVVRNAYRFRTRDIDGIIASVQRSIHSEANPREEHLFLIAERPVGSTGPYQVAYTTRAAGLEGRAPVTDALAEVALLGSQRLVLIASHEYEDGGEIWWIERIAPGRWRATWRSAATGC